jgi:hypothetical protein
VPSKHEPTWTDVGAIAEAVFVLTRSADLPHDLLIELALPSIRRLAVMGEQLLADPHGDGEDMGMASRLTEEQMDELFGPAVEPKTWRMYTPEETAAALSNLEPGTQLQAALLDALGCHKEPEVSTAHLAAIVGCDDVEKAWYALRCLDYLDRFAPDCTEDMAMSVEHLAATTWSKPEGYREDFSNPEWAVLRIKEAERLGRPDLCEYWADWLATNPEEE